MIRVCALAVSIGALLAFSQPAHAQGKISHDSIVYIECTSPDGKNTSKGTGLIVSERGRVLTARHVAPVGYTCKGIRGTAAVTPNRNLIRRRASSTYDAILLELVPLKNEVFEPLRYVAVDSAMVGSRISAYGFVGTTGEVVPRSGEISTSIPDDDGLLQTDVFTARGMSGGPVVLSDSGALIGIVAGAQFDSGTGLPNFYGVLSAELIAQELGLLPFKAGTDEPAPVKPPEPAPVQPPEAAPARPSIDALIAAAKAEGHLSLIGMPHSWCGYGAIIDGFKRKYPEIAVNELNPDAGQVDQIEAIKANKGNSGPQAPDVIDLGLSFGLSAQAEGLLMPYKVSTWDSIPDAAKDAEGYWTGDYYGVLSFAVNRKVVRNVPADWADLLKGEYKNAVALAGDPRSSNQAILERSCRRPVEGRRGR